MAKGKMLVVDDSQTQRAVFMDMLKSEGYTVIEAANGKEGLQKIRAESPDVVLTDVHMPNMDGIEMVKAVKNDEKTKYVPMICVSATYTDIAHKMRALLDAGAEEYFYLPQTREELLIKVEVMMRIRKLYIDLLEKNRQLKTFNDAAVGREMKMIELKEKIKSLEKELAKYKK